MATTINWWNSKKVTNFGCAEIEPMNKERKTHQKMRGRGTPIKQLFRKKHNWTFSMRILLKSVYFRSMEFVASQLFWYCLVRIMFADLLALLSLYPSVQLWIASYIISKNLEITKKKQSRVIWFKVVFYKKRQHLNVFFLF